MTDLIKVALIAAGPPTLASMGAFVISIVNRKEIKDLHVIVNSRLSQLLEEKGKAEHAAGRREGVESKD